MVSFPHGHDVVLVRRTLDGTDERGNDVYADSRETITAVSVQPATATEVIQGTEQISIDLHVFVPFDTDVDALDAIEYDGKKYEVFQPPSHWCSDFTGTVAPIEILCKVVTGGSV